MMARHGRSAFAAGVAFVLLGSAAAYAFTRAESVRISLRWHEGQTFRYRATLGLRGEAGPVGDSPTSFDFRVVETLRWRVRSVNAAGTATIDLTASDIGVQGGPTPGPRSGPVTGELTVDARGRVLAATDAWLLTGGPGVATYLPGLTQLLPFLPSGPVTNGAKWASSVSPSLIAFAPTARERLAGTFDGLQPLGTVIRTTALAQVDGTLDVGAALEATGRSTTPAGAPNPAIGYAGSTTAQQTAWIDEGAGVVLRTRATGTFDLRIESQGYPFLFPTFQTGPPAGQASAPFGGLIGAASTAAPTTMVCMRGSLTLGLDLLPERGISARPRPIPPSVPGPA